ncbi:MAG: hypothetical protein Q4F35_04120 [Akkermansia sp.]|nr:hypothetical protein [Akkermansia sp.]
MSLSISATSTEAISKLPPATSPAPAILACGCSHGTPLSPSPLTIHADNYSAIFQFSEPFA